MLIPIVDDLGLAKATILRRRPLEDAALPPRVQARLDAVFGAGTSPAQAVDRILADVRTGGDSALLDYTRRIDGVRLDSSEVLPESIGEAWEALSPALRQAMQTAAGRLRDFHVREQHPSWMDWRGDGAVGQIVRPLQRVGLYVPGGTAAYPSSVLHTAIPAAVAGVPEILVATPPGSDGSVPQVILAACHVAGVHHVFRMGGAQAIAALAFGTETVPKVDKILGPGNLFVALAKRAVSGTTAIDQIAGPTETIIIADDSADPAWVAADLLAQAEHDPLATAILLTPSRELAQSVAAQAEQQVRGLSRGETIGQSLRANGGIVLVRDLAQALELANEFAPEHLCLAVADAWSWVPQVRNAGGVFVGHAMSEALGDYAVGPSHVMPTGGTARFASPLHVRDFMKVTSVFGLGHEDIASLSAGAAALAEAEGLAAHAAAMSLRLRMERHETGHH